MSHFDNYERVGDMYVGYILVPLYDSGDWMPKSAIFENENDAKLCGIHLEVYIAQNYPSWSRGSMKEYVVKRCLFVRDHQKINPMIHIISRHTMHETHFIQSMDAWNVFKKNIVTNEEPTELRPLAYFLGLEYSPFKKPQCCVIC